MMNRSKRSHIACLLLMALLLAGCTEEVTNLITSGDEIEAGEPVMFTTYMPGGTTRATTEEEAFNTKMNTYQVVAKDYEFTVEMYEKTTSDPDSTLLGSATYLPTKKYTVVEEVITDSTYATDGTLVSKEGSNPLYWPGNAKEYGFKATAGTTDLATDQSTAALLLKQDRLLGYGFVPLWDTTNNKQVDDEDKVNYHTSKKWYANNRSVGLVPEGQEASDYYKKIPLYLKHQRSMITIILKAGEGVDRSALEYEKALTNIHTYIYSYSGEEKKTLTPFAQQTTVDYVESDHGGAAENVETTKYTAVVEPHNYLAGATSDVIAEIQLSGQRFTFYASNDDKYNEYIHEDPDATTHMANYNLPAGKNLIITAILGRASRKILITAYVVDWTEAITTSIVDDYGQAGEPIQITDRDSLYNFLKDETKNKQGNVAIIVPGKIDLEKDKNGNALAWNYTDLKLNCTLNMAGAKFYTDHQIFSSIGTSGNLVNGTIAVGNATVESAVADDNLGTIERVDIVTTDASDKSSTATATKAGLVETNKGTITSCTSVLPVIGTEGFVGGIAASSVYSAENGATMPIIDRCTVNAKVTGDEDTFGGGIVGQAVGRVTNNTYEYGITIQQNATNFKNIIQRKAGTDDSKELRAYGNSWPTTALNEISTVATYGHLSPTIAATNPNGTAEANRYTAVIDSQSDLNFLQHSELYNTTSSKIRISDDFTVTNWTLGTKDDVLTTSNPGNVLYELDGNDMTITTDGMLFTNIQNDMYDLTVKLSKNLIAEHVLEGTEAIAALAYSVTGSNTISNIKVKAGDYRIQAATVGGIVVWAYNGATIENCQCKANIQVWISGLSEEARTYAGGIAACAARATLTQCIFHDIYYEAVERNLSHLKQSSMEYFEKAISL